MSKKENIIADPKFKSDDFTSRKLSPSALIYTALSNLMADGVQIEIKNNRSQTFYATITFNELKIECFTILSDLLSQNLPLWLSQRISWYYSNKSFQEIVRDQVIGYEKAESMKIETKLFNREKLINYFQKAVPSIIKDWLNEKSKMFERNKENIMFSFHRTDNNSSEVYKYFECSIKNKRRLMEDKTVILENIEFFLKSNISDNELIISQFCFKPLALFGVFDGHCGIGCAQYVSTHLPMHIVLNPDLYVSQELNKEPNISIINQSLINSFEVINKRFNQKAKDENIKSGSTCCLCLITEINTKKYLTVGWCGDSQFCLVKNGKINFLSTAHKPENDLEKIRLENSGGCISFVANAWRVNGSLSVSRSFGDLDYQSFGVTCIPEIQNILLEGDEDYFIIGCDGLWESLEMKSLCKFIYENKNKCDDFAELLVNKARDNGSSDNITALFVLLKDDINSIGIPG